MNNWAEKLAEPAGVTKHTTNNTIVDAKRSQPQRHHGFFNAREIADFLKSSYDKQVQEAKNSKDGESIKFYKPLESSTQWKTKSAKSATNSGNHSKNSKSKNVPSSRGVKDASKHSTKIDSNSK